MPLQEGETVKRRRIQKFLLNSKIRKGIFYKGKDHPPTSTIDPIIWEKGVSLIQNSPVLQRDLAKYFERLATRLTKDY